MYRRSILLLLWLGATLSADETVQFQEDIAPVLSRRCVNCHNDNVTEGSLSFTSAASFMNGGDSGETIVPGKPDESLLIEMVAGDEPAMPQDGEPLSEAEVNLLRRWVASGAKWPAEVTLQEPVVSDTDWWSLQPLEQPALPELSAEDAQWVRTPIDAFVVARLREHQMQPSAEADRRTLIRRLYFDLIGLPPDFKAIEDFVNDPDPLAYEKLVDYLLESPHYGERWARHWLDVVHYGDTHGYDKDKPRPNAWPYRDYVIRSFNEDKPYGRFVQEQVAGDVLWPHTRDGIEATGFISAGPWDFIGHAEVPESKLDGQVARNLDRDDMVTNTMNTFTSTTVQCARCHNHKFDPVSQEHYYSLQSVFAALDRADKRYDVDPEVAKKRQRLKSERVKLEQEFESLEAERIKLGGERLASIQKRLAELQRLQESEEYPALGYHSQIVDDPDTTKWVQVDLEGSPAVSEVTLIACRDEFAGIGEGFGFPVRFRIEGSNDPEFRDEVVLIHDQTASDFANPKCEPLTYRLDSPQKVRYVRVTATKLAERTDDYIFALGELLVRNAEDINVALNKTVQSLDSIESPVRWQRSNLVDGYFFGRPDDPQVAEEIDELKRQKTEWLAEVVPTEMTQQLKQLRSRIESTQATIDELPSQQTVYCGTIHTGSGTFVGTGHKGGKPRPIHVLIRGDVGSLGEPVGPGTVPLIPGADWKFDLPNGHSEGERRAALAEWLVRFDNPLTWRSIVNRVWQYHFGRAIVDSPNDFGRMGSLPSHPLLLDWLAAEFRDGDQSLKDLHRLIVISSVYRQVSRNEGPYAKTDSDNQYLWRMNRRVLDAESVRDALLHLSGKLDRKMFGPPFKDFVIERPEHSPHYQYHLHDPNDASSQRRSIYRFLVRSQQQPFMQTLDCADPSESVAKRGTTITALQALAMLNNHFVVCMSEHFATRAESESDDIRSQVAFVHQQALGRTADEATLAELVPFAQEFGLAYTCRVMFNLNEFLFVD